MSKQNILKNDASDTKAAEEVVVSFTQRESECIAQALCSKNLAQIAASIGISKQSAHFYLRGVGKKFMKFESNAK